MKSLKQSNKVLLRTEFVIKDINLVNYTYAIIKLILQLVLDYKVINLSIGLSYLIVLLIASIL